MSGDNRWFNKNRLTFGPWKTSSRLAPAYALSANGSERWPECSGRGAVPLSEHNSTAGEIAVCTSDVSTVALTWAVSFFFLSPRCVEPKKLAVCMRLYSEELTACTDWILVLSITEAQLHKWALSRVICMQMLSAYKYLFFQTDTHPSRHLDICISKEPAHCLHPERSTEAECYDFFRKLCTASFQPLPPAMNCLHSTEKQRNPVMISPSEGDHPHSAQSG